VRLKRGTTAIPAGVGMTTLNGKRALITAGAGGIGRAITTAFVAAGAKVHVCDIDESALRDLQSRLPGVSTSRCDVGDRSSVQGMLAEATLALGGLDVLVNNAGIAGPAAPVEQMDPDAWDAVLRVNLTGTFTVTQLAIAHLKQSAAASIIVMSSLAGRFGYPNRSPYATTKWGLIGFTKTLSRELGEFGIRVNAILPGAVGRPAAAAGLRRPGIGQRTHALRRSKRPRWRISRSSVSSTRRTSRHWPCSWPRRPDARSRADDPDRWGLAKRFLRSGVHKARGSLSRSRERDSTSTRGTPLRKHREDSPPHRKRQANRATSAAKRAGSSQCSACPAPW
jgi:NAD(P)-dependent dehydrogenase (short-subunit alcohol dehydrogenase family)